MAERILMRATGRNGSVELRQDTVILQRVAKENEGEQTVAFPILKISSIQFSKGPFKPGYIHFTLLGAREIAKYAEAMQSEYCIIFDAGQRAEFEYLKLECEKRLAALRIDILNRPELEAAETKIEQQVVPKMDLPRWLEKNEKLVQDGLRSLKETINESVGTWAKIKAKELELEEFEHRIGDEQHRRGAKLLGGILGGILVLCLVAVYREQYELVRMILYSSFAAGAGIGLKELFQRKTRKR